MLYLALVWFSAFVLKSENTMPQWEFEGISCQCPRPTTLFLFLLLFLVWPAWPGLIASRITYKDKVNCAASWTQCCATRWIFAQDEGSFKYIMLPKWLLLLLGQALIITTNKKIACHQHFNLLIFWWSSEGHYQIIIIVHTGNAHDYDSCVTYDSAC